MNTAKSAVKPAVKLTALGTATALALAAALGLAGCFAVGGESGEDAGGNKPGYVQPGGNGNTNAGGSGNAGTDTRYADTDSMPLYVQGAYVLQEGDAAPDFTVELVDTNGFTGETISLADLAGKPAIIAFWATWCPYCIEDLPAYAQLVADYGDAFTMLAISVGGEEYGELKDFIAGSGYDFTWAVINEAASKAYPCAGVPYDLLIGADGTIDLIAEGSYGDYTYPVFKANLSALLR